MTNYNIYKSAPSCQDRSEVSVDRLMNGPTRDLYIAACVQLTMYQNNLSETRHEPERN